MTRGSLPPEGGELHTGAASVGVRPLVVGNPVELVASHVGPGVAHLADADTGRILLAVLDPEAVVHPHAVVLASRVPRDPLVGLRAGSRVSVGRGRVGLPDGTVTIRRWWSPRPALGHPSAARIEQAADELDGGLQGRDAALPRDIAERVHVLRSAVDAGDATAAREGAQRLLGLGAGSTPSGDDVLAGVLSTVELLTPERSPALDAVAALVRNEADAATTALSAVLLRHALAGEVCRPAARLLTTLVRGPQDGGAREREVGRALDALLAVGSVSGRDLAQGILLGLRVAARPAPPSATRDHPDLVAPLRREHTATGRT